MRIKVKLYTLYHLMNVCHKHDTHNFREHNTRFVFFKIRRRQPNITVMVNGFKFYFRKLKRNQPCIFPTFCTNFNARKMFEKCLPVVYENKEVTWQCDRVEHEPNNWKFVVSNFTRREKMSHKV